MPRIKRVGVLSHPDNPFNGLQLKGAQAAAAALGIPLQELPVHEPGDFERAVRLAQGAGAMLLLEGPLFTTHQARIVDLALELRVPTMHPFRSFAERGGLVAYGTNADALYHRAASFVSRILKGAKAGDLPVEQPTTFELAVNVKTAKALGLAVPRAVLLRADRVLE